MVNSRPNIWQLQSRRDVTGLVTALQYPDPEVRKRAAAALRTMDATQAVPALKAAFRQETDPQARANLAAALHVLDHRTDVNSLVKSQNIQGLIRALKSRHPETVIASAHALGKLGDRLAVEPLVILFHNSSSPAPVRLAAADALLELKSAPAVVTLLGALRRDSWQVRRNAAAVLGQIQATWAVEPLTGAMNDPHPVVRRAAAAALRRIGTAEAIAALRSQFAERTTEIRPAASPTPPPVENKTPEIAAVEEPVELSEKPTDPVPPPLPVVDVEERPSAISRPVKKLIAFLKQRGS